VTPSSGIDAATQQTVGALVSVERRLTMAAGLADDLATSLRRRETDLAEIRMQARKIRYTEEPRLYLHNAVDLAALTRRGLQTSVDIGDELLVYLDMARKDLRFARETISESASRAASAGVSSPELEALPRRVDHLSRIIQSATEGAERAINHLQAAERAISELAARPSFVVSEERREARQVEAVLDDTDPHITRAMSAVEVTRTLLEGGREAAHQGTEAAARTAADLARQGLSTTLRRTSPPAGAGTYPPEPETNPRHSGQRR
jgi:hypothetical protein